MIIVLIKKSSNLMFMNFRIIKQFASLGTFFKLSLGQSNKKETRG